MNYVVMNNVMVAPADWNELCSYEHAMVAPMD